MYIVTTRSDIKHKLKIITHTSYPTHITVRVLTNEINKLEMGTSETF